MADDQKKPKVKKATPSNKSNGKGTKVVKAYNVGLLKKNKHDVANEEVHKKYNATGKYPRKVPKFKKDQ